MKALSTSILALALLALVVAPAPAKKKAKTVTTRVTFTAPAPALGARSVTVTGFVRGGKGCSKRRAGSVGSLSGGSAPPTTPIAIAPNGSFSFVYTVSGPGRQDLFVSVLPRKFKKRGKRVKCAPGIAQQTITFS